MYDVKQALMTKDYNLRVGQWTLPSIFCIAYFLYDITCIQCIYHLYYILDIMQCTMQSRQRGLQAERQALATTQN